MLTHIYCSLHSLITRMRLRAHHAQLGVVASGTDRNGEFTDSSFADYGMTFMGVTYLALSVGIYGVPLVSEH